MATDIGQLRELVAAREAELCAIKLMGLSFATTTVTSSSLVKAVTDALPDLLCVVEAAWDFSRCSVIDEDEYRARLDMALLRIVRMTPRAPRDTEPLDPEVVKQVTRDG